jgi:hypothetical protein
MCCSSLKPEEVHFFETSAMLYQTTWHPIAEDSTFTVTAVMNQNLASTVVPN